LHYSTDYVFDGSKKTPYVESDPRNPLGVYGKSKAAGEEAIEAVFKTNHQSNVEISNSEQKVQEAQYAILRTSWVYGDGGNFIRTILRLAKERESLKVIADQYGVPTNANWLAEVSLACYAVQAAIDAGVVLKLRPEAIEAIPATAYPLPAPRPMNSRMARSTDAALDKALYKAVNKVSVGSSNMTKSQLLDKSWESQVAAYVQDLADRNLI
jgi:dTDP-4-dehydrorhamnose reductase